MSNEWLQGVWSATWATTVVAALLLILPRLLRRRFGAGVAYAAWWLFPAVLLAAWLPMRDGTAATATAVSLQPVVVQMRAIAQPVAQTPAAVIDSAELLLSLWFAGAIAMAAWLWSQQRSFVRGLGALQRVERDLWQAQVREGLPALLGVVRTRIVLPGDFEQRYDADQRRLMLAHERLHRRRGDHIANLCVAVVRCLFWFNPLVHPAAKSFRHDQELACDQAVIAAHPDSRRAYGEAMLNTLMADRLAPLGCHWGVSHPLKERMMQLKSSPPRVWTRRIGAATVAVFALGAGFAAWSSQPVRSPIAGEASDAKETGAVGSDGAYFYVNAEEKQGSRQQTLMKTVIWLKAGYATPVDITYPAESSLTPEQMESVAESMPGMRLIARVNPDSAGTMTATLRFFDIPKGESAAPLSVGDRDVALYADRFTTVDHAFREGAYKMVVRSKRGPGPAGCHYGAFMTQFNSNRGKFQCLDEGLMRSQARADASPAAEGASSAR